jgi:hypothetical protein
MTVIMLLLLLLLLLVVVMVMVTAMVLITNQSSQSTLEAYLRGHKSYFAYMLLTGRVGFHGPSVSVVKCISSRLVLDTMSPRCTLPLSLQA